MDNPTYYPYSISEFDDNSSSDYIEMASLSNQRYNMNQDDSRVHQHDYLINSERINYIKEIITIKSDLHKVRRSFIYLGIAMIIMLLVGFISGYLIVIQSYSRLETRVEMEDQQIYTNLKDLYKKCKENPMDFDWTAAIYDKMDEIAKQIPIDTSDKISELFQRLINYLVEYSDTSVVNQDMDQDSFYFKITKGEDIEIAVSPGKNGKSRMTRSERNDKHKNDYPVFRIPTGPPDPKITIKTTRSTWYGPPGVPGDNNLP